MICEGVVEKYSMGRSTGFGVKNWKTRFLTLTRHQLGVSGDHSTNSNNNNHMPQTHPHIHTHTPPPHVMR